MDKRKQPTPAEREQAIRADVARLKKLITPAEAYRAIALNRIDGKPTTPSQRENLRRQLGISGAEWPQVIAAAEDACMPVREYCRLMILCAAGHGGVIESINRVSDASFHVDQSPGLRISVKK
jgi:hypothetical protein